AVMAGAGTVRIEHYGRLVRAPELRARREQVGLAPDPLAVICSARLDLPPDDVPLLRDPDSTVVVLTTRTSPAAGPLGAGDGGARVELVRVGESAVDLRAGLRALRAQHGVRTLLCEGGPRLNAALLGAGLVDELFFSVAPTLAGGRSPLTIVDGEPAFAPVGMELAWVLEAESHLFLRYTIPGASG
ncbi:MAG TPA: dihydrofolate reductase family protein, partial [Solirubrobacteraceae bacterium]